MAAKKSKTEVKHSTQRKRFLDGQEVRPILCVSFHDQPKYRIIGGIVNGEVVVDKNNIPILFQKIGQLI